VQCRGGALNTADSHKTKTCRQGFDKDKENLSLPHNDIVSSFSFIRATRQ
jgi:hypothetical protein